MDKVWCVFSWESVGFPRVLSAWSTEEKANAAVAEVEAKDPRLTLYVDPLTVG